MAIDLYMPEEMAVTTVELAVADVQHLAAGAIERWWDERERDDVLELAPEVLARLRQMAKSEQAQGRFSEALYFACEATSLYRRVSDSDPDHPLVTSCRPIYIDMAATVNELKLQMTSGDSNELFCPCSICKRKSLPPQDGPSVLMPPPLHPITTLGCALDSTTTTPPPPGPEPPSQSPLTPAQKAYYRSSLAAADLAITKRISAFAQSSGMNNPSSSPPSPPSPMTQPPVAGAAAAAAVITANNEADKGKEKTDAASSSALLVVDAARRKSATMISRAREVMFADKTTTTSTSSPSEPPPQPPSDFAPATMKEKKSQYPTWEFDLSSPVAPPRSSYNPSPYHLRSDSDSLLTCLPHSHSSLFPAGSPSPEASRVHFHSPSSPSSPEAYYLPSPDASRIHFHTHSQQSSGVISGPDASQLSILPQQPGLPIFLRSSLPTGASPSFSRDASQSFGHSTSQSFTLRSTDLRSSETGFGVRPMSDGTAFNLRGSNGVPGPSIPGTAPGQDGHGHGVGGVGGSGVGGPLHHGHHHQVFGALRRSESPETMSIGRSSGSGPLPSSFHCQICLELEPMEYVSTVDVCDHQFGKDCLRSYIVSRLSEGRFPIPCPMCAIDAERGGAIAAAGGVQNPPAGGRARGGIISSSQATRVGLTDAEYAHWNELALAQFQIQFHCDSCSQTLTLDRDKFIKLKKSKKIACPTPGCDQVWCKECQKTVDKNSKKKHVCEGKAELRRLVRKEGWRLCPGCNIPIQKKEGCNHITCAAPGCNTHFCYRCGKVLVRSVFGTDVYEATHAHFRRRLYFWRCSQYQNPGFLSRLFGGRRIF